MGENIALIERYFAAFGAGDINTALDCVHPDAIWHVDGDPAVVTVGIIQGHDAVRRWLERFPTGFRPLAFSVDRLIGEGGEVIALGRFRHRVQPTDAIVDSDYAIRFTIRDGRIARYQIFEDSLLIAMARHSDATARQARLNGVLYGWDDSGSGRTIIFLHGLFLNRQFWTPLIDRLGEGNRFVTFDMPGHGVSTWRDGLDLDGIADDLALWIMENGTAPATIVGHSQGGMIALRLAVRHPDAVERLVLVNTSARAEYPERVDTWRTRRAALLDAGARKQVMSDVQRMTTAPGWIEAHPVEAAGELEVMASHNPASLALAFDAAVLDRGDVRPLLARIKVPVVVISGELDHATPPELGQEIAVSVGHGRHIIVDGAAHHVPTEQPDAIATLLRNG
ncbi:MAG: alpha/beta fold hydrolase [Novosphingobium sp.]|uniref:alpha/beta fold hydrolase n=1 Tax=Novosphingobium sp. TaxID=1874826 RepID=UPI002734D8D4|nr:alpha/beta fold hydrolase [Novosphingobium sp.]MDP3551089.1 alpha/beta fold hydrolase [Novosphingobium sp.]